MAWKVKNEMPIGSSDARHRAAACTPTVASTRVHVVGEEVRVLEDAEDDQVHRDRQTEQPARARRVRARAVDRDRHPVVERDRRQHQPRERAAALRVEDDAGDEQQPVRVRGVGTAQEVERRAEPAGRGRGTWVR